MLQGEGIFDMYKCREAKRDDFLEVSKFPMDAEELFYMFPKAVYPLTAEQLEENARNRVKPTVVLDEEDRVAGYANLYGLVQGELCWLGNVVISPAYRGRGAAEHLIRHMMAVAAGELHLPALHLVCHNTNTRALMFYSKLGFKPYDIAKKPGPHGQPVAGILMKADAVAWIESTGELSSSPPERGAES
jgi:N-acetylglutamate synthase-like GNAT family acetyltransferase